MNIAVVGTGYVGLVSGVCFAEMGNDVTCVDIDAAKVESLREGRLTIYEPGLEVYFDRGRREGRLVFTTDLAEAVAPADVIFLALPTPPGEGGAADLKYVLGVADDLGRLLAEAKADGQGGWGYKVVVDKSTVPVGTAARVTAAIAQHGVAEGTDFDVVSNPEFLREGVAVEDFMKPERVVVGTSSEKAGDLMRRLYEPFVRSGNPILVMDEASAEMTKYAANAMLATKITFMNDIANLCELLGADVNMVRKGIGSDPRIGNRFIYPGIGYGGSCFPKDVKALVRTGRENDYQLRILQSVEDVNESQKSVLFNKVHRHFDGSLKGRHFAMWGLSFKPETDDMREAPALVICEQLLAAGATVTAYDPVAIKECKHMIGDKIGYADDAYGALKDADALLLVTEWREFRVPDWKRVRSLLKGHAVFDGRNIYNGEELSRLGFHYSGIGVQDVSPAGS